MKNRVLISVLCALFCVLSVYAGGNKEVSSNGNLSPTAALAQDTSLQETSWTEGEDPFPEKAEVNYARGFTVEYRDNYKIITVLKPYPDAPEGFTYILYQRGTPVPQGFTEALVIEVPVRSFVAMSTTYIGVLKMLGLENALTGVETGKYVYDPEIRKRIADYQVLEVSNEYEPNIELLLEMAPDIVITSAMGNKWDIHPKMLEVNLPVVINGEWNETTPLGRAEWIKFISLFFNKEKEAEYLFDSIEQQYFMLRDAVKSYAQDKPSVFTGAPYGDSWDVPGGKSYLAALLADAGCSYIWKDTVATGSIPVSFETVFYKAGDAEFWLNAGWNWQELEELQTFDERLMSFKAFEMNNVFSNTKRMNKDGGNDYWESGVVNPHVLLADLIRILHPEILPDHELVYYQKLR